jgi:hypothetical protein
MSEGTGGRACREGGALCDDIGLEMDVVTDGTVAQHAARLDGRMLPNPRVTKELNASTNPAIRADGDGGLDPHAKGVFEGHARLHQVINAPFEHGGFKLSELNPCVDTADSVWVIEAVRPNRVS